jgi:hypothetical protein
MLNEIDRGALSLCLLVRWLRRRHSLQSRACLELPRPGHNEYRIVPWIAGS